ncbi:PAS domain S-box protein [Azospirillum sp. TSO22-1]|uniref:PAS domain S-box protein n=1 Tax=Azospirillum sp. TSO22-1 TaxID=716789 RepID=UPI001304903A|nr:PAS domain S-box protein [Azospirillum sp. TSO22-1]
MLSWAEALVELLKGVGLLALVAILYGDLEHRLASRPRLWPLVCGALFGAGTLISMVQPVPVAAGVIIDARSVMLGLAGPICGPVAAALAAAMAAAYRVWLGGAGMYAGLGTIVSSALIGVGFARIAAARRVRLGSRHMVLLGLCTGLAYVACAFLLPADLRGARLRDDSAMLITISTLGTAFLGTLLLRERRRVESERALRDNEARYRLIADAVSDVIGKVGPDGVLTFASGAVREIVGCAPSDLIGQRFIDLLHPADRLAAGALPGGGHTPPAPESRFTGRIRHADGRWVWVEVGVSAFAGRTAGKAPAYVMVIRDISERVESDAALRESEARYRLLAENVSDVIVRVSLDGVRTYCSGAVHDLFGYRPGELTGQSFTAHVHPDDRDTAGALFTRLTPGSPRGTGSFRMQHRDGSWVWTEASARLLTDPRTGEAEEFVFVIRDISDRRRMEEDLEEARRTAERANQSKSNFLAGLSHELRTPLNAIIGFADLIAREAFGPAGDRQYVQFGSDIRDSGQHLLGLINEILDHAKAEAGRLRLDEDTVDLSAAVRFCTRMITARAERSGVALGASVAPEAQFIRADEKRIRQILLNLLANAVKYTPSGGRVTVTVDLQDGAPAVTVSDTGIGIDEKDMPRVLQAFEQVENTANRQLTGTGLGLPLTRHLVELHGGTLTLSSRVGQGSTITARLPAERLVRLPAPCAAAAQAPGVASILVVDDDALLRQATVLVLEGYGHRVLQAGNANEALAVLNGGEAIDLLVTDVIMPPGMSGIELAQQVKRLWPATGIIVTSGFATHAVANGDDARPVYEMLPKPFAALELKAKIDALLAAAPHTAPCAPQPAPAAAPHPLRILVADDLDSNRTVASAILRLAGHVVDAVETGAEALDAVQHARYDLVLMDVQMPVMDGLAAARAIRALPPPVGRLPILALTAGALPRQIEECRDAGMDGHVLKPIERAALLAAVQNAAARMAYALDPDEADLPVLDEFILDELRESLSNGSCAELIDDFLHSAPGRLAALRAAGDDLAAVDRRAHAMVSYAGNVGLRVLPARCRQLCAAAHEGDLAAVRALHALVEAAAQEGLAALQAYRDRVPIPII